MLPEFIESILIILTYFVLGTVIVAGSVVIALAILASFAMAVMEIYNLMVNREMEDC